MSKPKTVADAAREGFYGKDTSNKLDGKVYGTLYKAKDDSIVPNDQYIVFLAKDDAFPETLKFYRKECERLGAAKAQLDAIDKLIEKVYAWRVDNAILCKVPDVDPGELSCWYGKGG